MGTWLRISGTLCVSAEELFRTQNFSAYDWGDIRRAKRRIKKCAKESWERTCGVAWSLDQRLAIRFFGPKRSFDVLNDLTESTRVSKWDVGCVYIGVLAWHRNVGIEGGRRFLEDLKRTLHLNGFSLEYGTRLIVTQDTSKALCLFTDNGFKKLLR